MAGRQAQGSGGLANPLELGRSCARGATSSPNPTFPGPRHTLLTSLVHGVYWLRLGIGSLWVGTLWVRSLKVGGHRWIWGLWIGRLGDSRLSIRCRLELWLWVRGRWIRRRGIANGNGRLLAREGIPGYQEALLMRHGPRAHAAATASDLQGGREREVRSCLLCRFW